MADSAPVYVVGGGWAGLASAVELSRHGQPVVVIESAKQLGGRARRLLFDDLGVDNGQHLLLGACHDLLDLLQVLGIEESKVLQRERLDLISLSADGRIYRLKAGRLPAPWHLAWAMLNADGYALRDRLKALRFCRFLQHQQFRLERDCTVLDLLRAQSQPEIFINNLWEPLCLAALNTPIGTASAQIFLRVLQQSFAGRRSDSDLLYPCADLSAMLPDPAQDFIEQRGGHIRLGKRVTRLMISAGKLTGLVLDGEAIACERAILAVPPQTARRLLVPFSVSEHFARQLDRFNANPICTIYLRYPATTRLNRAMLGMTGTCAQWVFDRRVYGQPGLMAVVISGPGSHMELDNAALVSTVSRELARHFPHWPAPERHLVIREKRATFDCRVNIDLDRPSVATPVEGLWLSGDYTNTGLPATLESAVRSGRRCAQTILERSGVRRTA